MARETSKLVTYWYVIADGEGAGPTGDGTYIYRFRDRGPAVEFAKRSTFYGLPANATQDEVPQYQAKRWGIA